MMHGRPLKQNQPSLDVTRINPEICIVPMHSCDLVSNPFTIYGVDEGGLGFLLMYLCLLILFLAIFCNG